MKGLFFKLRINFFLGGGAKLPFLVLSKLKKGGFLDRAVNFEVGCIYKTFGDKKFNLGAN